MNTHLNQASPTTLPPQFTERMKEMLGEEYPDFLKSFLQPEAKGLRRNPLKVGKEEFESMMPFSLTPVAWSPWGYYYSDTDAPGRHPYHAAGLYYIQEPSAQAVAEYLQAEPGERVLDLCAAPGGKTTQIAAAMEGRGLLVSNEIHPARAAILSENVERMGLSNVLVTNETPQRLSSAFPLYFDRILVDAPCSGEGMFRKNEEARLEWSPENVAMCAARQDEILAEAAKMLREGGILCYSTCTFSKEENEGCLKRFLSRHKDFSQVSCQRFWPHRVRGEGHFIAVLKKQEQIPPVLREGKARRDTRPSREGRKGQHAWSPFFTFAEEYLQPGVLPEDFRERLLLFGEQLYLAPEQLPSLKGLKVLRPGLHLGTLIPGRGRTLKGEGRFVPSHALALAMKQEDVRLVCSLSGDGEEIVRYLSGLTLPFEPSEGKKGWYLVTVEGFGTGWGKLSGGVLKNHYPKGLRQR
ncbi:MAG: RsmB/NOP family class I SAM-dependent RNA methyltransferase [Lachnospiraceae bacterium]|nr:RsmB/NOP family class I SAM-dependent RNA methyltransferase [Lachnospiraceae bacterium]